MFCSFYSAILWNIDFDKRNKFLIKLIFLIPEGPINILSNFDKFLSIE